MSETFEKIVDGIAGAFRANVEAVHRLMDFDNVVLEFAVNSVDALCNRLKEHHGIANPRLTAEKTLKHLQDIRSHGSMRPQYEEIFNQGVVLLVSYFGSALQDLFEESVEFSLSGGGQENLLKEELKMSVADIKNREFDLTHHVGEFLISSKNISFQDMQSIRRAFADYLNADPGRDEITNNIILGQGCRHVIVHNGAIVNRKLLHQIERAKPRTLKPSLVEDSRVQFSTDEVKALGNDMVKFVDRVIEKLKAECDAQISQP
jgi:hypothetical protein